MDVPARPEICSHWSRSRRDVALELVGGRALGRGAHDEPGVGRADAVEDLAQPLALVVGEPLRDAVGVGLVRHHHHEAAGEAHLLGEAGALVRDRVLGDLARGSICPFFSIRSIFGLLPPSTSALSKATSPR